MVAMPASTRAVEYAPVNSVGPFPVPFPLFDKTGADLSVRLNDEVVSNWTLTTNEESGFYGAPNTWVDCSITFDAPVTGELKIKGARAPRRPAQYAEGRGIPARDHNAEYNILTAVQQEQAREFESVADTAEAAAALVASVEADVLAVQAAVADANAAAVAASAAAAGIVGAAVNAAGLATGGGAVLTSPTITVPPASQAEAEAGVDHTKASTPLRVAQAIVKRGELAEVTPSWTAGRTRPLRTLIRDWCRLDQDSAFDRTGVTNMTALIVAALTAYDTVIVPANSTSAVANLLIPGNNKRLVGEGHSSKLLMPSFAHTNMLLAYSRTGLLVENLTMDGNRANQSAGNGTDIQGCADVRFEGVRLINWFGNGIICQVNCSNVLISECDIINVGSHGVSLSAVNVSKVRGCTITDARLSGVNYGACGNFDCSGNIITRNPALGATGGGAGGIRTTNNTTVGTIVGNTVSCYDRGIMPITGAGNTTISGNTILQPWYDGILVGGTGGPFSQGALIISDNIIRDVNASNAGSYDGIRIADTSGVISTKDNIIYDGRGLSQMQYGIRDTSTGVASNQGRNTNDNYIAGFAVAAVN